MISDDVIQEEALLMFAAEITVPGWGPEISKGGGGILSHLVLGAPGLREHLPSSAGMFPRLLCCVPQLEEEEPVGAHGPGLEGAPLTLAHVLQRRSQSCGHSGLQGGWQVWPCWEPGKREIGVLVDGRAISAPVPSKPLEQGYHSSCRVNGIMSVYLAQPRPTANAQ